MELLIAKRVILTCPDDVAEIYSVIGSHVSKVQNISKSRIYQEYLNIQIQFDPKQSLELQIWQYSPQKLLKKCLLSEKLLQFDGMRLLFKDSLWQIYFECHRTSLKKELISTKGTSKNHEKNKSVSSQKTLQKNLQKQINVLTGKKKQTSKNSKKKKKGMNFYSMNSKYMNNDSTREGTGTTSATGNIEVSMEYGLRESMGKNHRIFIRDKY